MGRYDGEDYDQQVPCLADEHNFATNGTCWRCGHSRNHLLAQARRILALHERRPDA